MCESTVRPSGPWVNVGPLEVRTDMRDFAGTIRVRLAPAIDGQPDPVRAFVADVLDDLASTLRRTTDLPQALESKAKSLRDVAQLT